MLINPHGNRRVTHGADWLRPGMGKDNIEAQGILIRTLIGSVKLAEWLGERPNEFQYADIKGRDLKQLIRRWKVFIVNLKRGVMLCKGLWNESKGLFCDNSDDRTHVSGLQPLSTLHHRDAESNTFSRSFLKTEIVGRLQRVLLRERGHAGSANR